MSPHGWLSPMRPTGNNPLEKLMNRLRSTVVAALGVTLVVTVAGCGSSSNPVGSGATGSNAPSDTIVIGSANFQESTLIADIYAEALKAKGVKVSTKLNIGARETYIPGLQDGSIDLIPEYSGVLLQYFDKAATAVSSNDVYAGLQKALPAKLAVLDQSQAEDKDSIAVTKDTASKYKLTSIADLASAAGNLVLGGPPEFKTRTDGVPGLQKTYNVTFGTYKTLDAGGPLSVNALKNGQVDAADIFTTDPSIQQEGFVVLQDPKNLYAAQNVLPLINKAKASAAVSAALNAVSSKLDTTTLSDLDAKVYAKQDPATVAKDWLSKVGLLS
jgi:osmoprotectant transport system substrate-binding protein